MAVQVSTYTYIKKEIRVYQYRCYQLQIKNMDCLTIKQQKRMPNSTNYNTSSNFLRLFASREKFIWP